MTMTAKEATLGLTDAGAAGTLNQTYRDAITKFLRAGMVGVGGMAGLGGLYGIQQMLKGHGRGKAVALPGRLPAEIRIPRDPNEEEDKMAGVADIGGRIADAIPSSLKFDIHSPEFTHPAAGPAFVGLGLGATYGTYKLMKWLVDKRRQAATKSKLNSAKRTYETALSGQFDRQKAAGEADDLGLEDLSEKTATGWGMSSMKDLKSVGGMGIGAYLAAALALGGGAGAVTYDWAKARTKREAVEKQLAEEQRRRRLRQPQPLFATMA